MKTWYLLVVLCSFVLAMCGHADMFGFDISVSEMLAVINSAPEVQGLFLCLNVVPVINVQCDTKQHLSQLLNTTIIFINYYYFIINIYIQS